MKTKACYSVGALLYCPANHEKIADSIISEKYGTKFSLALCLEDTIGDSHIQEAEDILLDSLYQIHKAYQAQAFYLPNIFVRVRKPKQIISLANRMESSLPVLSGFIAPKFCPENADEYLEAIQDINSHSPQKLYLMPILESLDIVNLQHRYHVLYDLKSRLDTCKELILNIRVGGNDLCHIFGIRRHVNESIHGISPVASVFSDILTVYGMDYVVSGPVWEYYRGVGWEEGLRREIREDLLCGFIGKTVIHPHQIPILNDMLRVSQKDLEDAKSILHWDKGSHQFVSGNSSRERMNEYKTHSNWALKTIFLAEHYGTK